MEKLSTSRALYLDLELTCGQVKESHKIIQLGIVEVDIENLVIKREAEFYIRPYGDYFIDSICTKLTGITLEDIKKRGIYLHEVLNTIKAFGYENKITFAWGDDEKALKRICSDNAIPFNFNFIDLSWMFRSIVKSKTGISVAGALKQLDLEFEGIPHRALVDARNTARIHMELLKRFRSTGSFNLFSEKTTIDLSKLNILEVIEQFNSKRG
jgi:inhibitor of KinA sporulation pathway (predicted exonuclease)